MSRTSDQPGMLWSVPRRHIIVSLLVMITIGSWAMDAYQVRVIPKPAHDAVASYLDSVFGHFGSCEVIRGVDDTVIRNPMDKSPVTFGSVVLLGILCAGGLIAIVFSSRKGHS